MSSNIMIFIPTELYTTVSQLNTLENSKLHSFTDIFTVLPFEKYLFKKFDIIVKIYLACEPHNLV